MVFPEKLIKTALKEASEIIMSKFGGMIEGTLKENQSSVVTEMDVAAERKIAHLISQKYPNHSIIGEEKGAVLTGSEYTWIIDPIDGTSNYAAGVPWFGTLIALMRHDQPYAAGAYLPVYDLLYYAELGKGAFCNDQPIHVSEEPDLKKLLFAYATDYSEDDHKTKLETDLLNLIIKNVRNIRATNCLVDFVYVADGRIGGYINHASKIWDIAAPFLIIKEAGGRMTDIHGQHLRFGLSINDYLKNYQIIAGGSNCFDRIVELARQVY